MDLRKELSKVLQSFMQYISPGMQVLRHISHHILYMYCLVYVHGRGYSESCRWEVFTSASLSPTMYTEKGWKWLGIGCATLSLYLERLPKAQIWYLNDNHRAPSSLQYAHQAEQAASSTILMR